MIEKPLAVVLGGTFPHIHLIKLLKERGYYTVLVDYNEAPPAKEVADEHIQESTLDKEIVLSIARDRKASLVISTCVDQANVTSCFVSENLGLPAPYDYETALSVTDKGLMKERMIQHGIPTSRYIFVDSMDDVNLADLTFPLAVKPADSNSSKGVSKVNDHTTLSDSLEEAFAVSRNGRAIVEEYKEGREIGLDCIIRNNEAIVVMTRERRKVVSHKDSVQQIQGSYWPAELTEQNQVDFKQLAENIARAFNLNNTPLMIQAILDNNEISIIEFAARIGGGENYRIIKMHTGFDIIDTAIDSFLGLPLEVHYNLPKGYYADIYLYVEPREFGEVTGSSELLKNNTIEYLNIYRNRGTKIGPELSSNNRVGAFLVSGNNHARILRKISSALEKIEIFDVHGQSIMRRDIYSAN